MQKLHIKSVLMTMACILAIVFSLPLKVSAETMYVNVSEDSWLNGRAEPNKRAEVECRFYCGDEVTVLEIVNGWAKVDEGGEAQYSYVSWDFLVDSPDGETKMEVESSGRVRVRDVPDGEVIGYVKDGDVVSVAFFFGGWAKTSKGWIKSEFLIGLD